VKSGVYTPYGEKIGYWYRKSRVSSGVPRKIYTLLVWRSLECGTYFFI